MAKEIKKSSSSSEDESNSSSDSSSSSSSSEEENIKKRKKIESSDSSSESESSSSESESESSSESENSSSESDSESNKKHVSKKLKIDNNSKNGNKKKQDSSSSESSSSENESKSESEDEKNKMDIDNNNKNKKRNDSSDSESESEITKKDDKEEEGDEKLKNYIDDSSDDEMIVIGEEKKKPIIKYEMSSDEIMNNINNICGILYGKKQNGSDSLTNLSYPNQKQVSKLNNEEKELFIEKTSVLSTKILLLMRNTLSLQLEDASPLSQVLQQLSFSSNPSKETSSLTYSDLTLWKDIVRNNQLLFNELEDTNNNNTNNNNNKSSKNQTSNLKQNNQINQTFRDFFIEKMTNEFGDDLDKLRDDFDYKDSMFTMLLEGLEAGIDIYSIPDKKLMLSQKPSHK